jgi:hypothetical protein
MLNGTFISFSALFSRICFSCCHRSVWIFFLSFSPTQTQKSCFGKFLKKTSPFSYPELDLGELLVNGRKTKNGTRICTDLNKKIKNGFVHLPPDSLSLRHVGRPVRYESIGDCGTLFCLVVFILYTWFLVLHSNAFHVNISLNHSRLYQESRESCDCFSMILLKF